MFSLCYQVGDGFHVKPVFANKAFSQDLSPFLMFDYGAPRRFEPTTRRLGVGAHPHRGFETVTIAFQGEVEHGDSGIRTNSIFPDIFYAILSNFCLNIQYLYANLIIALY